VTGPTGATGATGSTGATGPTGNTYLEEISTGVILGRDSVGTGPTEQLVGLDAMGVIGGLMPSDAINRLVSQHTVEYSYDELNDLDLISYTDNSGGSIPWVSINDGNTAITVLPGMYEIYIFGQITGFTDGLRNMAAIFSIANINGYGEDLYFTSLINVVSGYSSFSLGARVVCVTSDAELSFQSFTYRPTVSLFVQIKRLATIGSYSDADDAI
jgi:hypothetical protein